MKFKHLILTVLSISLALSLRMTRKKGQLTIAQINAILSHNQIEVTGFISSDRNSVIMTVKDSTGIGKQDRILKRVALSTDPLKNAELLNELEVYLQIAKGNTILKNHIQGIRQLFFENNYVYILMDAYQASLQDMIEHPKLTLTRQQLFCLSEQMIKGLYLIQSNGLSHNDVSLKNLVFNSENKLLYKNLGKSLDLKKILPVNYIYENFHSYDNTNIFLSIIDICY